MSMQGSIKRRSSMINVPHDFGFKDAIDALNDEWKGGLLSLDKRFSPYYLPSGGVTIKNNMLEIMGNGCELRAHSNDDKLLNVENNNWGSEPDNYNPIVVKGLRFHPNGKTGVIPIYVKDMCYVFVEKCYIAGRDSYEYPACIDVMNSAGKWTEMLTVRDCRFDWANHGIRASGAADNSNSLDGFRVYNSWYTIRNDGDIGISIDNKVKAANRMKIDLHVWANLQKYGTGVFINSNTSGECEVSMDASGDPAGGDRIMIDLGGGGHCYSRTDWIVNRLGQASSRVTHTIDGGEDTRYMRHRGRGFLAPFIDESLCVPPYKGLVGGANNYIRDSEDENDRILFYLDGTVRCYADKATNQMQDGAP